METAKYIEDYIGFSFEPLQALTKRVSIVYEEEDGTEISITFKLTEDAFEVIKDISQLDLNELLESELNFLLE